MKKVLIGLVVIVVLAVGAYAVTSHKSNSPASPSNSSSSTSSSSSSGSSNGSNPVSTNMVSIANFAFSPASITVKKGTAVTWTNHDSVAHNVVENDGKTGPNSSELPQGQTYSFTYNEVGTFKYICSIHPNMTGTVTVTE